MTELHKHQPSELTEEGNKPVPYLKDPSNFLIDSGLLFEINRQVLHPLGLALAVEFPDEEEPQLDPSSETATIRILDIRDDPEGYYFEDDLLTAGVAKIQKFVADNQVQQRLMARRARLGYVVQTIPPEPEPPFSVGGG